MEPMMNDVTNMDPIRIEFMYTMLYDNVNLNPILEYHWMEADEDGKYSTLGEIYSPKVFEYITPEELSNYL